MCANYVVSRMKGETESQKGDYAHEQWIMDMLIDDLRAAEASLAETLAILEAAKRVTRDGIPTDETYLRMCLDEVTKVKSEVDRMETCVASRMDMYRAQRERNVKQRDMHMKNRDDLRHQVGELEAASIPVSYTHLTLPTIA